MVLTGPAPSESQVCSLSVSPSSEHLSPKYVFNNLRVRQRLWWPEHFVASFLRGTQPGYGYEVAWLHLRFACDLPPLRFLTLPAPALLSLWTTFESSCAHPLLEHTDVAVLMDAAALDDLAVVIWTLSPRCTSTIPSCAHVPFFSTWMTQCR